MATVRWFADLLEREVGPLLLSVSRLDLHADFQGWKLEGHDRHRFVSRGRERDTYEEGEEFSGFLFGRRSTNTITARIYDKTLEVRKNATDYWYEIWGAAFDRTQPVLRVEFEIGREGLRQYVIYGPDEALPACGAIWADLTEQRLTYRTPNGDETKSRWPVATEWQAVQRASIRDAAIGLDRTTEGKRLGDLRRLMPRLVGDLTSFGVLVGTEKLADTLVQLVPKVHGYEKRSGITFPERLASKRAEIGRP